VGGEGGLSVRRRPYLPSSPTVRDDTIRWCGPNDSTVALVPNPMPVFSGEPAVAPHPYLTARPAPVDQYRSAVGPIEHEVVPFDGKGAAGRASAEATSSRSPICRRSTVIGSGCPFSRYALFDVAAE
jgi:hypothetical protein